MSETHIAAALRRKVAARASRRCEYCLIHEDDTFWGCEVDHIISEKHGGRTTAGNLAFCCAYCNRHKGADIATLDSRKRVVPLFHPRKDPWQEHFEIRGLKIVGRTEIGKATAKLLRFNAPARLEERDAMASPKA